MRIPSKIKIGAIWYNVKFAPLINEFGGLDYSRQELILDSNNTKKFIELSLFHEIFHAINTEMDEEKVEFLAQAIYQVLSESDMLK